MAAASIVTVALLGRVTSRSMRMRKKAYPQGPQVHTQGFPDLFGGGGGRRFRDVDLTPPRRLGIS